MNKSLNTALIILLFIAGFALRFVDFDDPPLDFHPARQMHSALMARGFFLKDNGYIADQSPEYNRDAMILGTLEAWIEPPIYEKLTAGFTACSVPWTCASRGRPRSFSGSSAGSVWLCWRMICWELPGRSALWAGTCSSPTE